MIAQLRLFGRSYLTPLAAGFVFFVCVAIVAISGWREWESRAVDLKNAEVDMANLARSLTQHAEDTFELADSILLGLVNRLEIDGSDPKAIAKLQAFLPQRVINTRIKGIFVYDETGQWLTTTESIDFAKLNNADREYFKRHRNTDDRNTFIGKPVKSRSGGQWIVTASRRFEHSDGSFAGVALVTIDVSYFSKFYEQFDIGPDGAVTLLSADGIILARTHDEASIGRDLSGARLFREMDERPSASVYYFKSPIDGKERLSFYKRSNRYPLVILATKAKDDVLAPWRKDALIRMAIVSGLTAFIAFIGLFIVSQLRLRQRFAAALVAKEADFRLLAEQSSDMVMRIGLDEKIAYVSPSIERILGWKPDQIIGSGALAGINTEDLAKVQLVIASLKSGEAFEARVAYRTRRRESGEVWVETALRSTVALETGKIDGVVAISRDISEQKALEEKLALLATSDGLTALANRRHFDNCVQAEWARAKRERTPLSLLMIDVDHFKKFNDNYGHQAGDACLQSIAKILEDILRRPADLAARYGGEEFVLLLPNTDADGCALIGEKVRQALESLAISHDKNTPTKRVTVSIGGALIRPAETSVCSSDLIGMADRALYKAKHDGRNCFVMSATISSWPLPKTA